MTEIKRKRFVLKFIREVFAAFLFAFGLGIVVIFAFPNKASAITVAERVKGRILLQIESRSEMWYVNPINLKRYPLRLVKSSLPPYELEISQTIRTVGLGITNADLAAIPLATDKKSAQQLLSLPRKTAGMILLKVQRKGEIWYVYPLNIKTSWKRLRRYEIDPPQNAYYFLRDNALGIRSFDLLKIPHFESDLEGDKAVRQRLAGRFLLVVDNGPDTVSGETWYIHPRTLKRYPARISHWRQDLWRAGIGISNKDLSWIPRL